MSFGLPSIGPATPLLIVYDVPGSMATVIDLALQEGPSRQKVQPFWTGRFFPDLDIGAVSNSTYLVST